MENKTIKLATISDIENNKNVHTLSMITKMDLKLNNNKNGNTTKIRNINFEDSLKMNDEQLKVKEAVFILQNLENFNYSISYSEIQNIRNDLRLFAVNSYHDKKYSDCLIQAIHSYMIAKKYYSKCYGFYLTGDMSTELILICKCYVLIEKYKEGKKYLQELKFLIDNTLLYTHKKGLLNEQQQKKDKDESSNVKDEINNAKNIDNNYEEPIILCEIEVLSNIIYIFADLLSLYKENEEAEKYFLKYLYIIEKIFNADSLNYSDALNDVCSYYIKIREYTKALTICEHIFEIRKKYFGDYNSENPSEVIADCYCNLGLLLRLVGNSIESLHKYLIAVDMRMRIHKTRHTIEVQDILFSFAIIMHQLNNFKISLQLYKEVYSFYKNYYGPEDINTIIVFKLIEELEKDIVKKSDRNEINANLEDYMKNINEKSIKDNKMDNSWNFFNEKLKNIPKGGDVDPNLIENLMNEKIIINAKNPYKNIGDKKTMLTLEGNFRYNDLSYCSIDAYRHMQSNKEFEILKSSFFTSSSINRIKSLYADSWKNTLIPSTYILPFVETKLTDEKLIQLSECKDFQNAIIFKRKILPIVNIPLIERGYVKLENDEPIMTCNEDAIILLEEWNIKGPFVDSQGKVISKYENLDNEFNMFISILDENNDIMLGFYNNPLLVPNPAIYHCIILNDPQYFDKYNQSHGLSSYHNIQLNNNKKNNTKIVGFKNIDTSNSLSDSDDDFSDPRGNANVIKKKNESGSSTVFTTLKSIGKNIEKKRIKDNMKDNENSSITNQEFNKNKMNDMMKEIMLEQSTIEAKQNKQEVMLKEGYPVENNLGSSILNDLNDKKSINELIKKPILKSSISVKSNIDISKKDFNNEKSAPNDSSQKAFDNKEESKINNAKSSTGKEQIKSSSPLNKKENFVKPMRHILKESSNRNRLFSKEKYVLKKFSHFKNLNEKNKSNFNNSKPVDTLEKINRHVKLKKEPIVRSSIDQNIKLDLQNNMRKVLEYSTSNLKREIYYDDFSSNNYTNSTNLSFDDDKETVASYREYKKNKTKNSLNEQIRNNQLFHLKSDNINKNKRLSENKYSHYSEEENEYDSETSDEDIIDIYKTFDIDQSSTNLDEEFNLNDLKEKNDNKNHNFCSRTNYNKNKNEKEVEDYTSFNDTINENSKNRENYDIKNTNFNAFQNEIISNGINSSEFQVKDKIKNIKSVKYNDISFKFNFDKKESFNNKNIFLESNFNEDREINKNDLENDSTHANNLIFRCKKFKKNIQENNELALSTLLQRNNEKIITNLENGKKNKSNIHLTEKESFLNNQNKYISKNNKLNNIDEIIEEILLCENENFYEEIVKETEINEGNVFFDTEKCDNNSYNNENTLLYKNEDINTNSSDVVDNSLHKNENNYVNDVEDSDLDDDFFKNNSSELCNGEATLSGKVKNEETNNIKIDKFDEFFPLRSNSIEELDSNLVTSKYKCDDLNIVKNEITSDNNIKDDVYYGIRDEINTDKNSHKEKYYNTSDHNHIDKVNDIKISNYTKVDINENSKYKIEGEEQPKFNKKDKIKISCNHNTIRCDNEMYINENQTENENNKGSNLNKCIAYNNSNNYTSDRKDDTCNIKDSNNYNDIYMVSSIDNSNHLSSKKKKKKNSYFLPLNKKNHILKLFSFLKKRKSKKKENIDIRNECIKEIPLEKDNPMHSISNSIDNKSLENKNLKTLTNFDDITFKKEKNKFLSEYLHGMEKPKLNLKNKNISFKKVVVMKKDFLSKKNSYGKIPSEKNEPLPRKLSVTKSKEEENNNNNNNNNNNKAIIKKLSKDDISKGEINKEIMKHKETKMVLKKVGSGSITNNEINEKENNISIKNITKVENNIEKGNGDNDDNNNNEVKIAKDINDKLPFDLLKKVKFCKIGSENDDSLGALPVVHLLNEDKKVIAIVPWQIDLTSFTLAKSSIEEETIKKLGLISRKVELTIDERKKQIEKESKLLSGEGLKELGLLTSVSTFKSPKYNESLISGIDMDKLKIAYKMAKKSEPIEKKEKAKKDAPKVPAKGGKKEPPKFMKGFPKNIKGGVAVGKGKGKIAKMKNVKDEGKTKRFFWEALFEEDIKGTLFEEKKDLIKKIEIEKENVEKSFAKVVSKKEETTETKIKKPKVIQLLPDSKREYNMSIALSKFNNYTFKEIRDAIMELNPTILNLDNTEVLMQYVPTAEEIEIVKEYINSNGDLNLVDKPGQYVSALIGVPLLKQRLESHHYALSFKENYENTLNPLESILESCEAVKNSTNLFTILFTILNVGNTLNYGDAQRGNALGFKLTTLSKLNDIRSSTKPVKTLLQYICELIYEKNEETLNVIDELRCIERVVKTEKQTIDALLQKLKLGSNKIKNVLEQAKKNPSDPLYEALAEFYSSVEPKIVELEKFYDQTFLVFKEIALYLGYKEKEVSTIQVHDFFKQLWNFIQSIEFNRKTLKEAAIKKLKKQEQALATEKKGTPSNKKQNFTIIRKQPKEKTTEKLTKKTFKIF